MQMSFIPYLSSVCAFVARHECISLVSSSQSLMVCLSFFATLYPIL